VLGAGSFPRSGFRRWIALGSAFCSNSEPLQGVFVDPTPQNERRLLPLADLRGNIDQPLPDNPNRESIDMSRTEPGFAERLQTATKAKQAKLEKLRAAALSSAPQTTERQAARMEAEKARAIRTAERKQANQAAARQRAAERAAEQAKKVQAIADEKARKEAERLAQLEMEAARKLEQKAARDAKYAARKARQR
jgi:hypothetical protein